MELREATLSSEKIFDGRILHVRRDTVRLPDGGEAFREVVDHPGGVCVLALDEENRALLVSQFRYPYEKVLWEVPAGKLEYGEDPRQAAIRELKEETGAEAGTQPFSNRAIRADRPAADSSSAGSHRVTRHSSISVRRLADRDRSAVVR